MPFLKKDIDKARDAFCVYDNISDKDDLYRFIPKALSSDFVCANGPPGTGKSKILHAIAFTYSFLSPQNAPTFLTLTAHQTEGNDLFFKVQKALNAANGGNVKRLYVKSALKHIIGGTSLLIDEASLIPLSDMKAILAQAKKVSCPVCIVGDTLQIIPKKIESGFPFALSKAKTIIEFKKIFRQENPDHKKATILLREGKIKQALMLYNKLGCFHFYDDMETLFSDLTRDFDQAPPDPRARVRVVLTPSAADRLIVRKHGLPTEKIDDVQGISQISAFVCLLKRQVISLPHLLVLLSRHKKTLKIYVAKSAFCDINDLCTNIHTAS